MALGSEMILAGSVEIGEKFVGQKIRRADAADCWLALHFSGDRVIFFSWDSDHYGVCASTPAEVRESAAGSVYRPPMIDAVKAHLVGAEVFAVSVVKYDRVLKLALRRTVGAGFFQTRYLLLEAAGRYSNLVLLDEDETVLEAAKHIHPDTNRYRSLLPGIPYTPPPPVQGTALSDFDWRATGAEAALARVLGIGRPLADTLHRMCLESPEKRIEILSGLESLKEIKSGSDKYIYQRIGNYVTLYPTHLEGATEISRQGALPAARGVVVVPLLSRRADAYRKKITSRLAHMAQVNEKKICEYERLTKDDGEADRLLKLGKLILANAWTIPPRADSAEITDWTEAGEPLRVTVQLDCERDAAQNADKYFARYRKRRAASEYAAKNLDRLYAERDEIAEQFALLDCHTDSTTLAMMLDELIADAGERGSGRRNSCSAKKTKKYGSAKKEKREKILPPHRRYEFEAECATIFCGLSAKGNHYVTFRLATPNDIWLHAQGIPGAHVILRFNATPDDETFERMMLIAASCAAYYSKARATGRVRVDCTERRHVRAIPGGGVAHVTYKEFSTINADVALWEGRQGEVV